MQAQAQEAVEVAVVAVAVVADVVVVDVAAVVVEGMLVVRIHLRYSRDARAALHTLHALPC